MTKHRLQQRVPIDLEPELLVLVEKAAKGLRIPRARLLRIFIKHGLANIASSLDFGDKHVSLISPIHSEDQKNG